MVGARAAQRTAIVQVLFRPVPELHDRPATLHGGTTSPAAQQAGQKMAAGRPARVCNPDLRLPRPGDRLHRPPGIRVDQRLAVMRVRIPTVIVHPDVDPVYQHPAVTCPIFERQAQRGMDLADGSPTRPHSEGLLHQWSRDRIRLDLVDSVRRPIPAHADLNRREAIPQRRSLPNQLSSIPADLTQY